MKYGKAILFACLIGFVCGSLIPADAQEVVFKKGTKYTVYNSKEKCRMVCKAPKPFLAKVEDGLAYALDIPLAILSPFTCPVVAPAMEFFDPADRKGYPRKRR
jgi:hypothetical protein